MTLIDHINPSTLNWDEAMDAAAKMLTLHPRKKTSDSVDDDIFQFCAARNMGKLLPEGKRNRLFSLDSNYEVKFSNRYPTNWTEVLSIAEAEFFVWQVMSDVGFLTEEARHTIKRFVDDPFKKAWDHRHLTRERLLLLMTGFISAYAEGFAPYVLSGIYDKTVISTFISEGVDVELAHTLID